MPTNPKLDRLKSQLLTSGLSGKDQPLYQVINTLIDTTRDIEESINVVLASLGSGKVNGPAISDDNAIARFDGVTGKLIQNSGIFIDDNNKLTAGNPTSVLGGDNTITLASLTGSTIARFESKNTGATAGAYVSLQSNNGAVFENGVFFGAQSGKALILTSSVNRLVVSKTDYLFALGDDLTSSFPALKRSSTKFQVRLGDDSAFSSLELETLRFRNNLSIISSPSDGNILLTDNAGTSFSLLQLGGISNAFPALKVNSTVVEFKLADDSAFTNIKCMTSTATADHISGANNYFYWTGRSTMQSESDGTILIANNGVTDFNRLKFGGASSSFPSIKRVNADISIRLADDSGDANLLAKSVRGVAVAFANVPATPVHGMLVAVTDSTTVVWGATITGGGANKVLAFYNGTNWTVAAI